MDQTRIAQVAQLLKDAYTGPKITVLPADLVPQTEDDAYAIQAAVLGDQPIAGWKVAAIAVPNPLVAAPLTDAIPEGPLPAEIRDPEIEVEIAIMIAADLPPRQEPYTAADVQPALGGACAAFEVVESRFAVRTDASPLEALADRNCNGTVILGSGIDDWQNLDLTKLEVSLTGTVEIARTSGNATQEQTMTALVWLANHASKQGVGLRKGQFVITGARIGPIVVDRGQDLVAEIEHIGTVKLGL
ncbi:2-keto-4-pentenoate hydratase [Falsirhodobacter sp. alg1]|uniref:2-keto-4-pentenoate hydratase n=1 Tax=Falsirhodobacter sp. alg1 TaxID=1472418 RepID=UPI0005F0C316|nr:fumarylacetoacetate hydrolase family protein [Falsirhodobacter sp. alg1]